MQQGNTVVPGDLEAAWKSSATAKQNMEAAWRDSTARQTLEAAFAAAPPSMDEAWQKVVFKFSRAHSLSLIRIA